jgi:hypothetical protein
MAKPAMPIANPNRQSPIANPIANLQSSIVSAAFHAS